MTGLFAIHCLRYRQTVHPNNADIDHFHCTFDRTVFGRNVFFISRIVVDISGNRKSGETKREYNRFAGEN